MVANLALAVVVVTCLVRVAFAALREWVARTRNRARLYAEMDKELSLLGPSDEALGAPARRSGGAQKEEEVLS
jgi:hypothetical protein